MRMGISWGDGEEEHEEVLRDGEGKVGEMGSWRVMERQSCYDLRQSPSGDFIRVGLCMMMKAPGGGGIEVGLGYLK
ncbi:hypothetical protein BPAE_0205g00190 [Botrytis paeoniae]|uniref:Uncharacterized protein n=1 Tax=Botrytis paeoniae TaxID=278948 RepID=A0A4Z1FGC8_9HELO|nr:hypothetical protein BPAE_0205g00190 [Botrytis paeoniae]